MDLPDVISSSKIGSASVGSSFYADDCMVWATAKEAATVKANFESISSSIGTYMNNYCLVLNQEKTQIPWVGDGGASSLISGGDTLAFPSSSVDVLGVSFDNRLTPAPHLASMLRSARALAGAIRRLSMHLRLPVLQQVIRALLVRKVEYACAVLRLLATDPVQKDLAEMGRCHTVKFLQTVLYRHTGKFPIGLTGQFFCLRHTGEKRFFFILQVGGQLKFPVVDEGLGRRIDWEG